MSVASHAVILSPANNINSAIIGVKDAKIVNPTLPVGFKGCIYILL